MSTRNIKIRDPRDNYETVLHPETSADVVQYDDEGIGLEAGSVQEAIEELSKNRVTIGEEKPEDGSMWFKIPWWESSKYLATDEDFEFIVNSNAPNTYNIDGTNQRGYFHYRGDKEKVAIPHVIMGNEVRDYYAMFEYNGHTTQKVGVVAGDNGVPVVAVYSDNEDVTTMLGMFAHFQATTLDLSSFNTSEVTDMSYMFVSAEATTLDLSNFNISKVVNMSNMFYGSIANPIYVSNTTVKNKFVNDGGAIASRVVIK